MYNAYRGVTDFTNINQFSQYEQGYQALFVLQMPWFMEQLDKVTGVAEKSDNSALSKDDIEANNAKADQDVASAEAKDNGSSPVAKNASTIRMIAVAAAGGTVGVAVNAAVLLFYSDVQATLAGDIVKAQDVTVEADMNFGTVQLINIGAAAGAVGVNAAVSTVYFDGKAKAGIVGDANIKNVTKSINVITNGTTDASVAAAAIAAGGVAVNAGNAEAINRTEAGSRIERGVTINAPKAAIVVAHDISTVNKLDAVSYVGIDPEGKNQSTGNGSITAKSLTVTATADGDTQVIAAAASGGVVSVNALVGLALGFIKNIASVQQMPVTLTGDMNVTAVLTGETEAISTSIAIGFVAVGASVVTAYIGSENKAIVDVTGVDMTAGSLTVEAGTEEKPVNPQATVLGITGGLGGVAVNVNVGLALNQGTNHALLTGKNGNFTTTGEMNVRANGRGRAYSALYSAAGGALNVNVSFQPGGST